MNGSVGNGVPWQRVEELFHEAVDLAGTEQEAFLGRECGSDTDLRRRVEALLSADPISESVVEQGIVAAFDPLDEEERQAVPDRVGAYRVVREIGRGGLATVFLAERDDEHFRKSVALKVVRRGLDTEDVLQRFRYERQILARFEHANIARLLDGGSLPDGRPFFVMEFVDGQPIDVYCADRGLNLRRRLELFREVCAAVSYAHRNLVVHRDLKPSNIFVTSDGEPKLLDFGIAKVLDTDDGRATQLHTTEGLLLLTPEFASPEQISGQVITTLTDVYSLGVLLYRLLTGMPPYALERRRIAEVAHAVCHEQPRPPSMAVNGETLAEAGVGDEAPRWRRALRGDLDTVVLKALSKDPQRRYASVDELSEDLRRFLHGERVSARPESLSYRLTKWVGRHRGVVSVLAAGALVLAAVVVFYTVELRRQRDEERHQAEKAERVSSLLVGMLEIADPDRTRGENVTARELLDRAAERLESELADQPEMRASLMELIGSIYGNLALFKEAEPLLEQALALRRTLHEAPSTELAEAVARLGNLRYLKGSYRDAQNLLTDALQQREALLGPDHPLVGKNLNDLAAVSQALGRWREAEQLYRQALGIQQQTNGPDDQETLITQANLATVLYQTGQLPAAETLCRETMLRQRSALGEKHPDLAVTENTLAAVLVAQKRFAEASDLLERVLERQKKLYGDQHPKISGNLTNLGALFYNQRRFDEAEAKFREALALQTKLPGRHHQVVTTLLNLADLQLHGRKDLDAAAELLEQAQELQEQLLGPDHIKLAGILLRKAVVELNKGNRTRALELLDRSKAIHRKSAQPLPSDHQKLLARIDRLLD